MWVVCIRSFEQHVKVCISTRQCAAMKADFLLSAASILCSQKNKHLEAKFDPLLYSITLLLPRLYYSYIRILLFGANSAKAIIGFLYNHPTVQIQFTLIVHFKCTMSTAVQLTTSLWKLKQDNTEAFLLFIVFFLHAFWQKNDSQRARGSSPQTLRLTIVSLPPARSMLSWWWHNACQSLTKMAPVSAGSGYTGSLRWSSSRLTTPLDPSSLPPFLSL